MNRFHYLINGWLRNECDHVSKTSCFWRQHFQVPQSNFFCDFSIHTGQDIVQVGVYGINSNIIFNRFDNSSLHIIVAGQFFQSLKDYRMMGYNEIAFFFYGFVYYSFCAVQCYKDSCHGPVLLTCNQAGIVIGLLIAERCQLFQMRCDVFYLYGIHWMLSFDKNTKL